MKIAKVRPRLIEGLRKLQKEALALWRRAPEYPNECAALRALAACDNVIAQAHVELPSGILTVECMDSAIAQGARRARSAVRRLRSESHATK